MVIDEALNFVTPAGWASWMAAVLLLRRAAGDARDAGEVSRPALSDRQRKASVGYQGVQSSQFRAPPRHDRQFGYARAQEDDVVLRRY